MNDTRIRAWLVKGETKEAVMIVEFLGYTYAGVLAVYYSEETGLFGTARLWELIIQ